VLQPTEHDVLRLGMRDQTEADAVERHPQVRGSRLGIQQLRQLQLQITVIAAQKCDEVRRHGAHACSADAAITSGRVEHTEVQDALALTVSRRSVSDLSGRW
jgi:hypothetical protein